MFYITGKIYLQHPDQKRDASIYDNPHVLQLPGIKTSSQNVKPDEVVGPVPVKEPSYRVTATLQRQSIDAYGKAVALQPDMQLSADILFERRSLIAWLLDPLFAAIKRAR